MTYAPPHETKLPHRCVGRRMGPPQALPPCSKEAVEALLLPLFRQFLDILNSPSSDALCFTGWHHGS